MPFWGVGTPSLTLPASGLRVLLLWSEAGVGYGKSESEVLFPFWNGNHHSSTVVISQATESGRENGNECPRLGASGWGCDCERSGQSPYSHRPWPQWAGWALKPVIFQKEVFGNISNTLSDIYSSFFYEPVFIWSLLYLYMSIIYDDSFTVKSACL